jgi:putative transposase
MSHLDFQEFYRVNLPHIQPPGAVLFVTFRLDGSIPQSIIMRWNQEKHWLMEEIKRWRYKCRKDSSLHWVEIEAKLTSQYHTIHRQHFSQMEKALESERSGFVWLKDSRVAGQIKESLLHRDGKEYRLDAFCLMSNHVHVVFKPLPTGEIIDGVPAYHALAAIMQSLKGYTAFKCNRILKRGGIFWEHESYDHYIRNANEYDGIVEYVLNNPVKAGLVKHWEDWQWNYVRKMVA